MFLRGSHELPSTALAAFKKAAGKAGDDYEKKHGMVDARLLRDVFFDEKEDVGYHDFVQRILKSLGLHCYHDPELIQCFLLAACKNVKYRQSGHPKGMILFWKRVLKKNFIPFYKNHNGIVVRDLKLAISERTDSAAVSILSSLEMVFTASCTLMKEKFMCPWK